MKNIKRKGRKTLKMKRENGVYNFSIRAPAGEVRDRGERVPMKGNRYAALIEDWGEDFQRQGNGKW